MVVARQVHHHEAAAADARELRLDHVEHKLHRGGGVNRVAALFQYARTRCRG